MRTRLARIEYRDRPADVAGYLASLTSGRQIPIYVVKHGQKV